MNTVFQTVNRDFYRVFKESLRNDNLYEVIEIRLVKIIAPQEDDRVIPDIFCRKLDFMKQQFMRSEFGLNIYSEEGECNWVVIYNKSKTS